MIHCVNCSFVFVIRSQKLIRLTKKESKEQKATAVLRNGFGARSHTGQQSAEKGQQEETQQKGVIGRKLGVSVLIVCL